MNGTGRGHCVLHVLHSPVVAIRHDAIPLEVEVDLLIGAPVLLEHLLPDGVQGLGVLQGHPLGPGVHPVNDGLDLLGLRVVQHERHLLRHVNLFLCLRLRASLGGRCGRLKVKNQV